MTVATRITQVNNLVNDIDNVLGQTANDKLTEFIAKAVNEFSDRRPYEITEVLTGDGNKYLALPANFDPDFSHIRGIEYPLDQDPPDIMKRGEYGLQKVPVAVDAKGVRLIFKSSSYPGSGITGWITYTQLHTVDGSSDTIPDHDSDAFDYLAAAIFAEAIASFFSQTADATIEADSANYRTRGDEWASRAKEWRKMFDERLPLEAAGTVSNWTPATSASRHYQRRYRPSRRVTP